MKRTENGIADTIGGRIRDNRGAFAVIFALVLLVLLGFMALGIEAGRWYLVRAELAKGVDAGALAAAKNISNPYVDPVVIAREFGEENFRAGYIDTPGPGQEQPVPGQVRFSAQMLPDNRVSVRGDVNARAHLARLFGVDTIPVSAVGVAQHRKVEIMMILDRSGSMAGTKMTELKRAANSFLDFFVDTQMDDKVGLISFATTVSLDRPLGSDFVDPMRSAINAMTAVGATNTEDALDRAGGTGSFTDQSGLPGDRRVLQFALFFSDGMPTALRDRFRYNGEEYDGVVYGQGTSGHANCMITDYPYMSVANLLTRPDGSATYPGVNPATTGDGRRTSGSDATSCCCPRYLNTKWYIFESLPVPGYTAEQCSIPMNRLLPHFCSLTRQLALQNAEALKNRGVKIYAVALIPSGASFDPNFLLSLSSGESYTYIVQNASELEPTFKRIARDIKLRLVQ